MKSVEKASFMSGWQADLMAGLTASTVVIPKAMAYATVAGLSVSTGLHTAFLPLIVYALLGGSKVLSVSTTTTLAILTGAALNEIIPDGTAVQSLQIATTLTVLTGLLLVVAGVCRLGFLANFISTPVLTGFKTGIGFVIILDQMPKLLGIKTGKEGFFRDLYSLIQHLPDTSMPTLYVALASLVLLVGVQKLMPRLPASLIVVAGGILASWLMGLQARGVSVIGTIPQELPPLTLPDFSLFNRLVPEALGLALMSFTETASVGRAFRVPGEPIINANRELAATGLANAVGGFFGAMPGGGGASQTAVVRAAGGLSQKANIVTALMALATMLVLAPVLGLLPNAIMAVVVIMYSVSLIQWKEFRSILGVRAMEFRWAVAACLGVLIFGTLKGILIAIIMSVVGLAYQASKPRVSVLARKRGTDVLRPVSDEYPDDELIPGLLIVRPEGRIFFVNAQIVGDRIRALIDQYNPDVLVLDMSGVIDIEFSALSMLIEAEKRMTEAGLTVWFSSLNPDALAVVRRSGLWERLGRERMLFNSQIAIERYQQRHAKRDNIPPAAPMMDL